MDANSVGDGTFYAYNEFTGDGVTKVWEFRFINNYINKTYVKVQTLDGVDIPFRLLSTSTVEIDPPVAKDTKFKIFRQTDRGRSLIKFVDGTVLTQDQLNKMANQSVDTIAELYDSFVFVNNSAVLAATKSDQALKDASNAKTTADKAIDMAQSATNTATEATTIGDWATTMAQKAIDSADKATTDSKDAREKATNALNMITQTATDANSALQAALGISDIATTANSNSETALNTAKEAKTTADSLANSITAANTTASDAKKVADQAKQTADAASVTTNTFKAQIDSANTLASSANSTSNALKTTVDALKQSVDKKVDKVAGKGLSTCDYTQAEKDKISCLEVDLADPSERDSIVGTRILAGGAHNAYLSISDEGYWGAFGVSAQPLMPENGGTGMSSNIDFANSIAPVIQDTLGIPDYNPLFTFKELLFGQVWTNPKNGWQFGTFKVDTQAQDACYTFVRYVDKTGNIIDSVGHWEDAGHGNRSIIISVAVPPLWTIKLEWTQGTMSQPVLYIQG